MPDVGNVGRWERRGRAVVRGGFRLPSLEGVPPTAVVAVADHHLASPTPTRPTQRVSVGNGVSGWASCQESPYFRHCELDDLSLLSGAPAFFGLVRGHRCGISGCGGAFRINQCKGCIMYAH
jgi:hypothetical protein